MTSSSTCVHVAAIKVKSLQFILNTGSLLILNAQEPKQDKTSWSNKFFHKLANINYELAWFYVC